MKVDSVTYLRFVISKNGLCIDPQKVTAIQEMPTPKDRQGVQRLLGMTNFVTICATTFRNNSIFMKSS